MKFLWIYVVVANLYFFMYLLGNEIVVKYAVGPFYLLMVAAPVVGAVLVANLLGLFRRAS